MVAIRFLTEGNSCTTTSLLPAELVLHELCSGLLASLPKPVVQQRWYAQWALVFSLHGFNSLKCMFIEEYLINRCNDRFNDRKSETPVKMILQGLNTVWKGMRASCVW